MGKRAVKTERMSLTLGERLQLWRRRRGDDQRTAAKFLGVQLPIYGKLERDQIIGQELRKLKIAPPALGALKMHERCYIARKRTGKTQVEIGKEIKRCRWWVNQMEHGRVPCDDLAWYWFQ